VYRKEIGDQKWRGKRGASACHSTFETRSSPAYFTSVAATRCGGAEADRSDGDDSEAGIFAALSDSVPTIRGQKAEPVAGSLLVTLFFALIEAAKFDASGTQCLFTVPALEGRPLPQKERAQYAVP
jgi:hypothetical protein